MKKLKIATAVLSAVLLCVVLLLRLRNSDERTIDADAFSVYGLTNGIAVELGDTIDGITVSLPEGVSAEDVISVSSDEKIAYIRLIRDDISDRVIQAEVIALSDGIAELYVRSTNGEIKSAKYTVNVFSNGETVNTAEETKEPIAIDPNTVTVYVTKTGSKYHLSKSCAGDNASGISLIDAVGEGYTPCRNCSINK